MAEYIMVTLDGKEIVEVECEDDGSFLLDTISAVVGSIAGGLRHKNEATGNFRGVKVVDGKLIPPKGGWGSRIYYLTPKADVTSTAVPVHVTAQENVPIKAEGSEKITTSQTVKVEKVQRKLSIVYWYVSSYH